MPKCVPKRNFLVVVLVRALQRYRHNTKRNDWPISDLQRLSIITTAIIPKPSKKAIWWCTKLHWIFPHIVLVAGSLFNGSVLVNEFPKKCHTKSSQASHERNHSGRNAKSGSLHVFLFSQVISFPGDQWKIWTHLLKGIKEKNLSVYKHIFYIRSCSNLSLSHFSGGFSTPPSHISSHGSEDVQNYQKWDKHIKQQNCHLRIFRCPQSIHNLNHTI